MDITVYLPDEIGERAKKEEEKLNLSRLLREAVTNEFERRDAMAETLSEIETYEVEMWDKGVEYTGRITGRELTTDADYDLHIYLTSDGRVLSYFEGAVKHLNAPGEDLVANLADELTDRNDEFLEICKALGLKPVIDL